MGSPSFGEERCYEASQFPARSSSKELQVGSTEGAAMFPALQFSFVGQVKK